ncbi:MAG: glycoside hydrolase family 99-like domain-containing protein [Sphingobacteriaceae bacterium]|nr:glycoside hydrolase family 99-like domain-containing protein [Sphingobacteriaceae bacterium]
MQIIAYYLPQYYPFKENNEWWGEGFTEWTNVGKAKPLFRTHYQPKVPADLGYYDLRIAEVRQKQIELAIEAGVTGFCYWHYWFGDGKRLLDMPFREVLSSDAHNFPFCLGWANESWKSKVWNSLDAKKDVLLMEQTYPGKVDIENHFYEILPAIKDSRYIKIENRPVFVIYKPFLMPNAGDFIDTWNKLAKLNGFDEGFFFIGHAINSKEKESILKMGFDAVNIVRIGEHRYNLDVIKKIPLKLFKFKFLRRPLILKYAFISKYFIQELDKDENVFPTIIPNWDHTPRSGNHGTIFHKSNPELFKKHVLEALKAVKNKSNSRQVLFLKSWNEWGEGNYMEPDLRYGKQYIQALRSAIEENSNI